MYIRRKGYGMMGLAGAESCGSTQAWDENCTFNGIKGQCVSAGTVGKAPGCTYPAAAASTPWYSTLLSSATDILKAKVAPAPVTNISTTTTGMSNTTKLALAGAAVVGVLLIMKSRK